MPTTNQKQTKFASKKPLYIRTFSLLPLIFCLNHIAWAEDYEEFNPLLLQAGTSNIDISRFSYGSHIPAGEYITDIYVNETYKGRANIQIIEDPKTKASIICSSETLYALLDLKPEAIVSVPSTTQDCLPLVPSIPQAKTYFDIGNLELQITAPHAIINHRPKGYISPAQWQDGIPVAFVRYDASTHRYRYNNSNFHHTYLGVDAGINLFGWAFRHRGSQIWAPGTNTSYQTVSTFAQHDVAPLRAQLTIGDFYTNGRLVESFGLRGIQLASDDRMLATSVRSYAPIVHGVANTNATVTVKQNGQLLRELSVPPGAFEIDDLYPISYGGDLDVEITESNGQKRSFSIPYTASVQLLRPGYSRYQLALGQFRYGNKVYDEKVAQATFQYGLNNYLTANVGGTYTKNYHAELVGLAINTPIGAFSGNTTFSHATLRNKKKAKGYSLSLNYNTHFAPTNTNITLAAYRYSSQNFYSLQSIIRHHNSKFDNELLALEIYSSRPKHQFQATITQELNEGWGSLYLTGSSYTYWNSSIKEHQYQIGYSNSFKGVSYNLSFSQSKNSLREKNNLFFLSVSIPLSKESSYHSLAQTVTHSERDGYGLQTSVFGSFGQQHQYSYNISANKQQHYATQLSATGQYYGSLAQVGASWSRDSENNQQTSFNLSGAVVAHPKGITFTNSLNDTFAIVHAKGAEGAVIQGTPNNTIDRWGNGIVPYLNPYNINYVSIDPSEVSDSVEFTSTEQQIIPRANNAVLVNFTTTIGKVIFFELKNINLLPPIGTEVFNKHQEMVGVVAQGGRIYTRGIAEQGKLHLKWDEYTCSFDYHLPKTNDEGPIIMPVQCQ